MAFIAFMTFIYSFVIAEPDALNTYTKHLETEHFAFVFGGRWYFLGAAITFIVLGLRSIRNSIQNGVAR